MNNFDAHIFGPVFSATGVGESARAYWRTLMATGLKVGVFPQAHPFNTEERLLAESFKKYIVSEPHPRLNFYRINAQEVSDLPGKVLQKNWNASINVLIPMWETPRLPTIWEKEIVRFDHIIAATSFIKSSIESTTKSVPVSVIPQAITTIEDKRVTTRGLGLSDDRRYHLYSFSYSSYVSRKNPMQFLELKKMYCQENQFGKDVFVLASSDLPRSESDIFFHNTFRKEQDSNFVYLSGGRTRKEHLSLIANANTFISVHRSEGIGLQLVEAMKLGTNVVTHNFSGPADFIYPTDPGIFPFTLNRIEPEEYPHSSGHFWAKMNTQEILRAMLSCQVDSRASLNVRQRVIDYFSLTHTSELSAKLLSEIS
jgi:glycosyltransferase involved in cell wall biosynthesis